MDNIMLQRPSSSPPLPNGRFSSKTPTNKSSNTTVYLPPFKQTNCAICKKSFGVRKRHRRRSCRRCDRKVCEDCSTKKRYDFSTKQLVKVCDGCLKHEHQIRIAHRIENLKLKSKRNAGIFIAKTAESSREYQAGFVTNCKIIEINGVNVESFTAQQIANKLNLIKLPFRMILDYSDALIGVNDLRRLLREKRPEKSLSVGLNEHEAQSENMQNMEENIDDQDSNESKSSPSSPKVSYSIESSKDESLAIPDHLECNEFSDDQNQFEFDDEDAIKLHIKSLQNASFVSTATVNGKTASYHHRNGSNTHHHRHHRHASRDHNREQERNARCNAQQTHSHPLRQFCVVFTDREFDLCVQFRNGYSLFAERNSTRVKMQHSALSSSVWGWYTVRPVTSKNIPIGSKLISVNGVALSEANREQYNLRQLLLQSSLPISVIFEAPSYVKSVPRSTYIQYEHSCTKQGGVAEMLKNYTNLLWWLEDGGLVLILLALLALIVLDWPLTFILDHWYLFIIMILSVWSNDPYHVINWLFFKRNRLHVLSSLFAVNHSRDQRRIYSIVQEQRLHVPGLRRISMQRKQKQNAKEAEQKHEDEEKEQAVRLEEEKQNEHKVEEEPADNNEPETPTVSVSQIDSNWERNLCHPMGRKEMWGSYSLGSSPLLSVRGSTYLTDKIKIKSNQSLFRIAHIEVFESHKIIDCMAEHEASWFYQHRHKFPLNVFFMIFHLRMDSLNCSIVIYWYLDKDKYKSLLLTNRKIANMAKTKGAGYWCVGSNNYDESGMFWNFINGECKYRNDRLKMIARKHEGSWYLHIPSTPAIIAKKIPMIYYRGYDKKELNSVRSDYTRSEQYDSYKYQTLCHEEDRSEESGNAAVPCNCGRCYWTDTDGKYPEYLELHFNPEAASPIAKNTIKMAAGVTKSLSWELHFLLEGQRNNIELPETVLANARISYINLDRLVAID